MRVLIITLFIALLILARGGYPSFAFSSDEDSTSFANVALFEDDDDDDGDDDDGDDDDDDGDDDDDDDN